MLLKKKSFCLLTLQIHQKAALNLDEPLRLRFLHDCLPILKDSDLLLVLKTAIHTELQNIFLHILMIVLLDSLYYEKIRHTFYLIHLT